MPTEPTLIAALPTPPARSDPPDLFISRADAWVGAQPSFRAQINDLSTVNYNNAVEAEGAATTAINYAIKVDGFAAGSDNSAKSWAIGGTGAGAPAAGDAKSWATKTGSAVASSEFSAKEHASGTSVTTGSAKDWAQKTSGVVITGAYSAKEWSVGTQIRGVTGAGSAKDWAIYTGGTVDGTNFSAKYHAEASAASAVSAAGSKDGAEAAQTAAEAAQGAAEAAQVAAETAQTGAETAQAAAENLYGDLAAVEAAKDAAETARDVTQGYRDTTLVYRDEAEDFKDLAQTAAESAASTFVVSGSLYGLTLANNVADATNDIDILSGDCASLDPFPVRMVLESTITKRLDAAWAEGSGNGGLDTGTKANSTGYHVWLIRNPTTEVVDALFSTSATNPTMPSGYTQKRRIGCILTDTSGVIRPFMQTGGKITLKTPVAFILGDFTTPVLASTGCPLGVKLELELLSVVTASTAGYVAITDPDLGTPDPTLNALFYAPASLFVGNTVRVWCNTSGQVYADSSATTAITSTARLRGWYDLRDTNV